MAGAVVRRWNARKTKKADFGSGRGKRNDRLEVWGRSWLFSPLGFGSGEGVGYGIVPQASVG